MRDKRRLEMVLKLITVIVMNFLTLIELLMFTLPAMLMPKTELEA